MHIIAIFAQFVLSAIGVLWIFERIADQAERRALPEPGEEQEADAALELAEHGVTMENVDRVWRVTTDSGVVIDIPDHVKIQYSLPGDEVSAASGVLPSANGR